MCTRWGFSESAPSHCNKEEDHVLTDRRAGYDANGRGHTDMFNQHSLIYLYALGLRYFKQHPHFCPDSSKPWQSKWLHIQRKTELPNWFSRPSSSVLNKSAMKNHSANAIFRELNRTLVFGVVYSGRCEHSIHTLAWTNRRERYSYGKLRMYIILYIIIMIMILPITLHILCVNWLLVLFLFHLASIKHPSNPPNEWGFSFRCELLTWLITHWAELLLWMFRFRINKIINKCWIHTRNWFSCLYNSLASY